MSPTPRQRWRYSNWASHLISCQCAHARRVLIVSPCLTLIYRRRTDVIGDLVAVARWFVAFIAVLRFWFHSTPRRWVHGCEQECVVSIIILKLSTSVGETRSANHLSLIKTWPIRTLHHHHYELHLTSQLRSGAGSDLLYWMQEFLDGFFTVTRLGNIRWFLSYLDMQIHISCVCGGRVHPRLQMQTVDRSPDAC